MTPFATLNCILEQHDIRFVALAALICLFATYTTLTLITRARAASSSAQSSWLAAAAVALGGGVWTTHFVAMLAYRAHTITEYAMQPTVLSIVVAIMGAGVGLTLAITGARRWLLGGIVIGLSIGAMHYIGMSAMQLAGHMQYDSARIVESLLIGVAFSMAALRAVAERTDLAARIGGAALLSIAICGLHFTGMAATSMISDNALAAAATGTQSGLLAVAIAAVTILILTLSLGSSLIDEHLANRTTREAARLRASEARFRQLADATFEGILIHIDGRVVDANAALCRLVGHPLHEVVERPLLDFIHPGSQQMARKRLSAPTSSAVEIEILGRDGSAIPVEALGQSIDYAGTPARVVAIRDLRERRQAQRDLHHLTNHDLLTGLANRALFHHQLAHALTAATRIGAGQVAVLCLGLDRFKQVNDLFGQSAGDTLLKTVAQRIADCMRAHDTVARIGGDEFGIIQTGVAHVDTIAHLAERLIKAIEQPYVVDGQQLPVSASIGIAISPGDGGDHETLLRAANTALHRAKQDGRRHYRFFEAAMDLRLQERNRLEHDLRHALAANEQLEVYYQPLYDCKTAVIVGCEALLRWQHPQHGFVSPADFIPIAEDCGLIVPLSEWVLSTACRDAAGWPEHLRVAVNLSPAQFHQPDLSSDILNVLARTGLPPQRLELELTESVLIEDTERTLTTLRSLKAAGIHISLDDFGTGYSSLSYLQRFPFDKLKIDRSFVWGMEKNADSMAIVRAVIALGHSLRISITAEGVETQAQLDILRREHCDHIQGFLLGKPQPLHQLNRLLEKTLPALVP